ncbi:MAG: GGDEF domain-containing protein [Pseudomonadota bacterium]
MGEEIQAKFDSLKKEYLSLETVYQNEKECLLKLISTLGLIVDIIPKYSDKYREIKQLLKDDDTILSIDSISKKTSILRRSIFEEETKAADESIAGKKGSHDKQLLEPYKVLDRVAYILTDNFYPLNDEMKQLSETVRINYKNGVLPKEFNKDKERLLDYIYKLKGKISEDFKHNSKTFLNFFTQVTELEKILTSELDEGGKVEGFEEFEKKINNEVGSIVSSFSIYSTINDVKNEVLNRLSNIKQMLAKKKKEEEDKSQKAQKKIHWLRKKISLAEVEVQTLSKKANQFKEEANKDGLTGLYNRKAFDMKIIELLESLNQGGAVFLMVMFDVDNFKWINDTYGHVAGDRVLQKVAATLTKTFRKDEFIARYGGDEFAVIIENMPEAMAQERILSFNESFSKTRFFSNKEDIVQISVSAGISSAAIGDNPDELIHNADIAMYEVKKNRSNKL